MRDRERVGDLARNRSRLVERNRAPGNARGEVVSDDELHDEGARVARILEPMHGRDVGMVQLSEGLRFALESGQPVEIGGETLGKDLDRHVSAELRVAGSIDFAHAASPKRSLDFVGTDP